MGGRNKVAQITQKNCYRLRFTVQIPSLTCVNYSSYVFLFFLIKGVDNARLDCYTTIPIGIVIKVKLNAID